MTKLSAHVQAYKYEKTRNDRPVTFGDVQAILNQLQTRFGNQAGAAILAAHGTGDIERLDESSYSSLVRAARALLNAPPKT